MEEHILDSIKVLLGIQPDDFNFDKEIVMHINAALGVLNQVGVGPEDGFRISSNDETWDSLLADRLDLELVKSYTYLRVRLLFDPPQNSFLVDSIKKQIEEFEWRLKILAEPYTLTAEEEAEEE